MKRIFLLLSMLGQVLAADAGGFASAAEFQYPSPGLEPPQLLSPAAERTWSPAGMEPFRAELLGFYGEWGNDAIIMLRTPSGRRVEYDVSSLSDADIDSIREWIKLNSFENFETYREGKQLVRILSVVPLRDGKSYFVRLVLSNGTCYALKTNCQPMNEHEAQQQMDDRFKVTNDTLEILKRYALRKPETAPVLPIVTSTDDALLYSSLHRVGIVVLYLNRRGSAVDEAFRQYLTAHPEWVAQWAGQFVFMLAYADEKGGYPPQCHANEMRLHFLHQVLPSNMKPPVYTGDATQRISNATLVNNQQISYVVYYHHFLNGNPYQRSKRSGVINGSVFCQRLLQPRQDEFNFYSY